MTSQAIVKKKNTSVCFVTIWLAWLQAETKNISHCLWIALCSKYFSIAQNYKRLHTHPESKSEKANEGYFCSASPSWTPQWHFWHISPSAWFPLPLEVCLASVGSPFWLCPKKKRGCYCTHINLSSLILIYSNHYYTFCNALKCTNTQKNNVQQNGKWWFPTPFYIRCDSENLFIRGLNWHSPLI